VSEPEPPTLYERVGGQAFFDGLAGRFYAGVAADPVLRPLYPEELDAPARRLAGFLAQYWGGPPAYSAERGHPRLRMRHLPFRIGAAERDAWLRHLRAALDAAEPPVPDDVRAALLAHVEQAAGFLVNAEG
jgi:hemoglobin